MKDAGVDHLVQKYVTGHAVTDIMGEYVSIKLQDDMQRYFDAISPLLEAMHGRAIALGLVPAPPLRACRRLLVPHGSRP